MTVPAHKFDYADLPDTDRVVVEQKTGEIRDRVGRAALNIFEIGQRLIDVKDHLPHGEFGAWLRAEFEWSEEVTSPPPSSPLRSSSKQ